MKLYRLSWYDPAQGVCVSWHPTKPAAEMARRLLDFDDPDTALDAEYAAIRRVEVPTSTLGLVAWLNVHLTRDNG